jgi:hypothetical protein
MKTLAESDFLQWAAGMGLRLDPQYPDSAVLAFLDMSDEARFWTVPVEPQRRLDFVGSLLDLFGDWRVCYAWRHLGSWPAFADPRRINDVVEFQILKGLGLPLGTTEVVAFSREEVDKLVTLIFSTTIFGCTVAEDLYIVPDHARAMLQTDHHDVIHVVCRDGHDLQRWVERMKQNGFPLPESVPDSTFKVPSWLTSNNDEHRV